MLDVQLVVRYDSKICSGFSDFLNEENHKNREEVALELVVALNVTLNAVEKDNVTQYQLDLMNRRITNVRKYSKRCGALILGKTIGCAPGRPNPGGKRGGDFFCCCCVCGLLRPGGGLFAISPLSNSSTVQAFGKDNRG
ncbi:hypothetical protein ALC57_19004 [Trachymyrmex cornetzi]|uniref:Uncharacterized protein n=1 Tax=Trachymyrmex cornetzi TaxID=471704 RepID=A0A195D837_9HYME|nr:hypothetical protein ALC57_19004 [Trachymyrmex cornetzi]